MTRRRRANNQDVTGKETELGRFGGNEGRIKRSNANYFPNLSTN